MATTERRNTAFVASIAALAFICACIAHEVIGHGLGCAAAGGRVTRLSSVYFRCSVVSDLADAGGPLMNLIIGGLPMWLIGARPAMASDRRLFLVLVMAFNLLWGTGYLIYSAVVFDGDLAFLIREWPLPPLAGRLLMGLLGMVLYRAAARAVAARWPANMPLLPAYLAAGMVSCLAALAYPGPSLPTLAQAVYESFGAGAGLLVLARRMPRLATATQAAQAVIPRYRAWLLLSILVVPVFMLTLGRGLV